MTGMNFAFIALGVVAAAFAWAEVAFIVRRAFRDPWGLRSRQAEGPAAPDDDVRPS